MIFTQWELVLSGKKTMTRRLVQPRDYVGWHLFSDGLYLYTIFRWKTTCEGHGILQGYYYPLYAIGRTYAVQPGRGKPAIWIGADGTEYDAPLAEYLRKAESGTRAIWGPRVKQWLREHGYREARVRMMAIRKEQLQDISPDDCWYEGVRLGSAGLGGPTYRMHFEDLWNTIATKRGTKWCDDPEVWAMMLQLAERGVQCTE